MLLSGRFGLSLLVFAMLAWIFMWLGIGGIGELPYVRAAVALAFCWGAACIGVAVLMRIYRSI